MNTRKYKIGAIAMTWLAPGAIGDRSARADVRLHVDPPGDPGLAGNYGYLTDYSCMDESAARARVDEMVSMFHVTDVQFYDWFANYSQPRVGQTWTDPWFHERQICLQTIEWYIDELHRHGGRAWAYVQSVAAETALSSPETGVYPVLDANGTWVHMGNHPTYSPNAAWARHQVSVWGESVHALGFDGIHWDTLGPIAGDYSAETAGIHAFLSAAAPLLASDGLLQTMNFVNVSWWDDSLLDLIAFPYAEVWSMTIETELYTAMADSAMQARWGVMAFYPSVDMPNGWTQDQVMSARFAEAYKNHLRYLIVGNGERRLETAYFPDDDALTPGEISPLTNLVAMDL